MSAPAKKKGKAKWLLLLALLLLAYWWWKSRQPVREIPGKFVPEQEVTPNLSYLTNQGYSRGDVSAASLHSVAPETMAYLNQWQPFGLPLYDQWLEVDTKGGDTGPIVEQISFFLSQYQHS